MPMRGAIRLTSDRMGSVPRTSGTPDQEYAMAETTTIDGRGGRLTFEEERDLNERAAQRLAIEMAQTHAGQWVGLVRGEVACVAPTLDELSAQLMKAETAPGRGFVFQAGEDYQKKMIILAGGEH